MFCTHSHKISALQLSQKLGYSRFTFVYKLGFVRVFLWKLHAKLDWLYLSFYSVYLVSDSRDLVILSQRVSRRIRKTQMSFEYFFFVIMVDYSVRTSPLAKNFYKLMLSILQFFSEKNRIMRGVHAKSIMSELKREFGCKRNHTSIT